MSEFRIKVQEYLEDVLPSEIEEDDGGEDKTKTRKDDPRFAVEDRDEDDTADGGHQLNQGAKQDPTTEREDRIACRAHHVASKRVGLFEGDVGDEQNGELSCVKPTGRESE